MSIFSQKTLLALLMISLMLLASCGRKNSPRLLKHSEIARPAALSAYQQYFPRSIQLKWKYSGGNIRDVRNFVVLRAEVGGRYLPVASPEGRAYLDTDLSSEKSYKYRIGAIGTKRKYSESDSSLTVSHVPGLIKPEGLKFEIKDDRLLISWKSAADDARYNLYRAEGGKFMVINAEPVAGGSFAIKVGLGSEETFMLRQVVMGEVVTEGPYADNLVVLAADYLPKAPAGLRLAQTGEGAMIHWQESSEGWIRGYKVYQSASSSGPFKLLGSASTPAYFIPDADQKAALFIRIRALGPTLEGPFSATLVVPKNQ